MSAFVLRFATVAVTAGALALGGCDPIVDVRGHVPQPGVVEKLEVGSQGRDDVLRLMGSPSAVASFNDDTWYYVTQRQEAMAFFEPKVAEQTVIAVRFDENGRVKEIKNYTLKDAKVVDMVDRKTPTAGKELTVLEQIFGNVGRFNAPKK